MSKFKLTPQLRRILEIAGTLEQHEQDEHKLFDEVCQKLKELEDFCAKQQEEEVYGPIAQEAQALCAKLQAHFDRYGE